MDDLALQNSIWESRIIERELFELGLNWKNQDNTQTILVSAPSIKGSAGFLSLGLMCRDLINPSKNNKAEHFKELITNAEEYIHKCRNCKFPCKPQIAECGRANKATNELKNIDGARVYEIESTSTNGNESSICVSYKNKPTKKTPFPNEIKRHIQQNYSDKWHYKGQPPLSCSSDDSLNINTYKLFVNEEIHIDNVQFSYSGLVYIGANQKATEQTLDSIIFNVSEFKESISKLLTLKTTGISRVEYISALTAKGLDKHIKPNTAVFEDLYSFKLVDHQTFINSHKFLVIRAEESDQKLNDLYDYYSTNRQWFKINEELTEQKNNQFKSKHLSVLVMDET
ncbi:MAG: hypothetical protein ACI83B_002059 [Sediminicola sp.]|jgi:hypothetical protein